MIYPLYAQFVFAFFSTLGFCFLFHVPAKHLPLCSINGACGWTLYAYLSSTGNSNIMSCFLGACLVALLAEFFSRAGKDAATLFIIPGILPLVPGASMYNTMQCVLQSDLNGALTLGTQTLFMAGGIALALLIVASLTRIIVALKRLLHGVLFKQTHSAAK